LKSAGNLFPQQFSESDANLLALYYLETRALVKLYVREPGTERLLSLTALPASNRFAILSLSQVEFRSAIRRRARNGEIPSSVATQLLDAFHRHSQSRFLTVSVTDFLVDLAASLVDRYPLRAFDAVQLAGYITLRSSAGIDVPFFVCADRELLLAAQQEAAPILDASS
jgi:predicted nucleic acid-binding protein